MNVIVTDRLSKSYGPRRGIIDLSLSVREGEVFGFLGPNGAGKTTAIRVLLGFLRPNSGSAKVFGMDCVRQSAAIKRDVGYLSGDLRLYAWMNGRSALRVIGAVRRMDLTRSGAELAERFGLDLGVRVGRMSRGMRQKLGLILTFAHRPKLLILDEPSSALDPIMQQRLRDYLLERASAGCTVFFSSHTLSEVEDLCGRVAILREGRLVAGETLAELRRHVSRLVVVRWANASDGDRATPPTFLEVQDRAPGVWRCLVDGPIRPLLAWAAAQPIDDLAIGEPDLETLFRAYYGGSTVPPQEARP